MASLIPCHYAQSVIDLFKLPRDEVALLLEELGLSPDLLAGDGHGDMTAEDFGALFTGLIRRAQSELQGSEIAAEQVSSLSVYRLLFTYMLQGTDLREALNRAALYFMRFQSEGQGFELGESGDSVEWRFNFPQGEDQASIEHFCMGQLRWLPGLTGKMTALYTWHRIASWLVGNFIDLSAVHVDEARQGAAETYISPFRAPFYFRQTQNSLCFHSRYLDMPLVRGEDDLNSMLATFPAQLIRADEMADSMAAKVIGLLGMDYREDMPSLEEVAARLATTAPTLHRRLRAEATSYQKIKDGVRRDAAIAMLRGGNTPGSQIAEQLGFSDASTFYRAFKKWTGFTPQEFSRQKT